MLKLSRHQNDANGVNYEHVIVSWDRRIQNHVKHLS